jgi:hypothetical protein
MFGGTDSYIPYVAPRNLMQRSSSGLIPIDIACMYRCDTGCKIKFTAEVSGQSYEWTPTANTTSSPVYGQVANEMSVCATGDRIKVEVYRETTAAIEIHALAIFQLGYGNDL